MLMRLWDCGPLLRLQSKRPVPVFCWDRSDKFIPAVPPGLARFRALLTAYIHTRTFDHGGSAPSHILGCPFCSPSEVHSFPAFLPRFHPRRLSVRKDYGKYSLFFNGLSKHSTRRKQCARGWVVLLVYSRQGTVPSPDFPGVCLTCMLSCMVS